MIAGVVMPVSTRVALESPVSSEMNEEDESPEADLDYLDEYDSEEERRQRKKRKVHFFQLLLMIVCHFSRYMMYCLCVVFRLQPRADLWLQLSSPHSEFPPEITRKTNPLPANVSLGNVIARVW